MMEYVLACGNSGGDCSKAGEREKRGRGGSTVPNTTDRPVLGLPSTFDLYLYEDGKNWGGRGGSYSATIELDRTVPSSTDSKLYHLRAILVASECARVLGSG